LSAHRMIPTRKHLEYALGYIALSLLTEARAELALIRREDEKSAGVLVVKIELAMAEEAWRRVDKLASEATQLVPTLERPWIAWAYALRELQKVGRARAVLLEGELVIEEPTVLVDYNLACYFCLLGDLATARWRLANVFKREPTWKAEAADDPDLAALYARDVDGGENGEVPF